MAGISEITSLNSLFKNGKDLQKQKQKTQQNLKLINSQLLELIKFIMIWRMGVG